MEDQETTGRGDDTGEGLDKNLYFGIDREELLREETKAKIGYMSVDIMNPPKGTKWGHFNDRPFDEPLIAHLVAEFPYKLLNSTDATSLRLAVRRKWVKNADEALETADGANMSIMPRLELTDEGEKAVASEGLWMLSGNHRREALGRFLEKMREWLAKLDATVAKYHGRQLKEGAANADDEREKTVKAAADKLRAEIGLQSRWAVKVYDRGELSFEGRLVWWGEHES